MKQYIIWNSEVDLQDWQDAITDYEERIGRKLTEEAQYELINDINLSYLEDEQICVESALQSHCDLVLAVASLGLWNGRCSAYKLVTPKQIMYSSCDAACWFVEGKHLKARMAHHDGFNYVTYYAWRPTSEAAGERLLDDIYDNNPISIARLHRHAKPLGDFIKKYYGWED